MGYCGRVLSFSRRPFPGRCRLLSVLLVALSLLSWGKIVFQSIMRPGMERERGERGWYPVSEEGGDVLGRVHRRALIE